MTALAALALLAVFSIAGLGVNKLLRRLPDASATPPDPSGGAGAGICAAISFDRGAHGGPQGADRPQLEQLRSSIAYAPVAIALFDRDMRYLAVSERWKRDYGLGDVDIIGRSHYQVFPEIPPRWRDIHRRALAGETLRADEDRFERRDGAEQWVRWEVCPWQGTDGAPGGIILYSEDISERKRVEVKVRLDEMRYRSLIENATDAIFVHDASGRIVEVSRLACESVGYAREELLLMNVVDLETDFDLARAQAAWSLMEPGTNRTLKGTHRRKDGSRFPVEVRFGVMDIEGQRLYVGAVRDVSERDRAEAAVRDSESQLHQALDAAQSGVWVWDVATNRNHWSPEVYRLYGLEPGGIEPSYDAWLAAVHPNDRAAASAAVRAALRNRADLNLEWRVNNPAGHERWLLSRGRAELGPGGAILRYHGIVVDITTRKRAELALRQSEELYRSVFQTSPDAITINRLRDGLYVDVNDGFCRVFRWAPAAVIGKTSREIGIWRRADDRKPFIEALRRDGHCDNLEAEFVTSDGKEKTCLLSSRVIEVNEEPCILTVTRDISERKKAEQQLRKLSQAVEQSPESIIITDPAGIIEYVNRAFCQISGYSTADVLGKTPEFLKSGRTHGGDIAGLWEAMKNGTSWQGEFHNRRKNGSEYTEFATIAPIRQPNGEITHFVAVQQDITERVRAERQIQQLAYYDQLTGLPNRTLLFDRLRQSTSNCARQGAHGVLMMIDLDHFKVLNDTLGHDTGDQLLRQVAARVGACVRAGDTLARLGGDEFMLVMNGLSGNPGEAAADAQSVARKVLATFESDFPLDGIAYHCTASVGLTLFNSDLVSTDELMKQADLAMYKAKEGGRDALRFFDPQMEATVKQRSALERDLRRGLDEHQFLLHYQPQLGPGSRVTGAEVLVRWMHPARGLVSPAEFIPVAEDSGLIVPLGNEIFHMAFAQMAAWSRRPALAGLSVAVNVSARQIRQADFVDAVKTDLEAAGADPSRLKLEITESLLIENPEDIIEKMLALKAMGVGFSLDDFGTGFSSLTYLKRLPLDQLKIDQSFVRDILTDPNDAVIARTIIALAGSMGLGVIAEGVETEAQRAFLSSAGCDAYQGYLYSRPLPAAAFEALMERAPSATARI